MARLPHEHSSTFQPSNAFSDPVHSVSGVRGCHPGTPRPRRWPHDRHRLAGRARPGESSLGHRQRHRQSPRSLDGRTGEFRRPVPRLDPRGCPRLPRCPPGLTAERCTRFRLRIAIGCIASELSGDTSGKTGENARMGRSTAKGTAWKVLRPALTAFGPQLGRNPQSRQLHPSKISRSRARIYKRTPTSVRRSPAPRRSQPLHNATSAQDPRLGPAC